MDTIKREDYLKTLWECSKDDKGNGFVESNEKAYKLDEISTKEAELYRHKKNLAAADAFIRSENGKFYVIEFKNTRKSCMPKNSLYPKAHDSIFLIQLLFEASLSLEQIKERTYFFVIYNDGVLSEIENASSSFDKLKEEMKKLAGEQELYPVHWGMERYEKNFYKKVYTLDVKDFQNEFMDEIFRKNL